ncbi:MULTISPECIES: hypothetical protein [unclassified Streptomyces]|uniref:hypothetical protein n=1 Tax=unclassified Streptomyces TaxID=2593676 RepID=UPI00214B592F|nr:MULTISPECIES: hypothetical protein [unclassified Streptomyces]
MVRLTLLEAREVPGGMTLPPLTVTVASSSFTTDFTFCLRALAKVVVADPPAGGVVSIPPASGYAVPALHCLTTWLGDRRQLGVGVR